MEFADLWYHRGPDCWGTDGKAAIVLDGRDAVEESVENYCDTAECDGLGSYRCLNDPWD